MSTKPSRNPWPIAIAGFFIIAVIFIATFIAFAMRQREDLVSSDYYEREVRYQSQLDAMKHSQAFAAQTVVTFEPAGQSIVITLPSQKNGGVKGSIHLYRPSDARLDRELPLALNAEGIQRLDAKTLSDGLWKVRVTWSAGGEEFFIDQPVVITSS
jgi:nitrogen fixation protein FixH